MIARHRNAIGGDDALLNLVPVVIAPRRQIGALLVALQDDAGVRFVGGQFDRAVDQRFVGDDAPRFDPAAGGDDRFWCCIVDPCGKFVGGEPPEHHGMDCPDPRTGQHRNQRLRDHRHVDDDPVA